MKTKQAILVAEYAAPVQGPEATTVVERLADYLISVGFWWELLWLQQSTNISPCSGFIILGYDKLAAALSIMIQIHQFLVHSV